MGIMLLATPPALAQSIGEAPRSGEDRQRIDLTPPPAERGTDPLLAEQCEDDADAARIAGEIVVCRSLGEVTDGAYDHADFIERYAEATQGPKTPDFIIDCHDQGWPLGCFRLGSDIESPLLVDVEALPEAPPASDAHRIARGLAPRADQSVISEDARKRLQDELGLPPSARE